MTIFKVLSVANIEYINGLILEFYWVWFLKLSKRCDSKVLINGFRIIERCIAKNYVMG